MSNSNKKMTLRQRLRVDANDKLLAVGSAAFAAVEKVLEKADTGIESKDLMKFISGTQVATLQEKLITELANEAEAKLEALYNKQMELIDDDQKG